MFVTSPNLRCVLLRSPLDQTTDFDLFFSVKEDKHCVWIIHHVNLCPEQCGCANKPGHLCLLLSTWPQSASLLGGSVLWLTMSTARTKKTWVIWCLLAKSRHVIMAHDTEQVPRFNREVQEEKSPSLRADQLDHLTVQLILQIWWD